MDTDDLNNELHPGGDETLSPGGFVHDRHADSALDNNNLLFADAQLEDIHPGDVELYQDALYGSVHELYGPGPEYAFHNPLADEIHNAAETYAHSPFHPEFGAYPNGQVNDIVQDFRWQELWNRESEIGQLYADIHGYAETGGYKFHLDDNEIKHDLMMKLDEISPDKTFNDVMDAYRQELTEQLTVIKIQHEVQHQVFHCDTDLKAMNEYVSEKNSFYAITPQDLQEKYTNTINDLQQRGEAIDYSAVVLQIKSEVREDLSQIAQQLGYNPRVHGVDIKPLPPKDVKVLTDAEITAKVAELREERLMDRFMQGVVGYGGKSIHLTEEQMKDAIGRLKFEQTVGDVAFPALSGHHAKVLVEFERELRDLGMTQVNGRPFALQADKVFPENKSPFQLKFHEYVRDAQKEFLMTQKGFIQTESARLVQERYDQLKLENDKKPDDEKLSPNDLQAEKDRLEKTAMMAINGQLHSDIGREIASKIIEPLKTPERMELITQEALKRLQEDYIKHHIQNDTFKVSGGMSRAIINELKDSNTELGGMNQAVLELQREITGGREFAVSHQQLTSYYKDIIREHDFPNDISLGEVKSLLEEKAKEHLEMQLRSLEQLEQNPLERLKAIEANIVKPTYTDLTRIRESMRPDNYDSLARHEQRALDQKIEQTFKDAAELKGRDHIAQKTHGLGSIEERIDELKDWRNHNQIMRQATQLTQQAA